MSKPYCCDCKYAHEHPSVPNSPCYNCKEKGNFVPANEHRDIPAIDWRARAERAEAALAEMGKSLVVCQDANCDYLLRTHEQEKTIDDLRARLASKEIVIRSRDETISHQAEQALDQLREIEELTCWRIKAIKTYPDLERLE